LLAIRRRDRETEAAGAAAGGAGRGGATGALRRIIPFVDTGEALVIGSHGTGGPANSASMTASIEAA
jgi:hypothetical protein